jgi:hypothetical protein
MRADKIKAELELERATVGFEQNRLQIDKVSFITSPPLYVAPKSSVRPP